MKFRSIPTSDFFLNSYTNWASYDNLRKIGSLVDGQKNAARKVLAYTLKHKQTNEIKVAQLDSKVAEEFEYLHGSMVGVIDNLAANYTGTNNMNLLHPEGNFGTRLVPEASAPRYIYTYGTPELFGLFNTYDINILEKQVFEGHEIESVFLLPKLPLILINGSEGISSGFAQKILPRNPKEIEKYLKYYLDKPDAPRKPFKNKPFFRGFKGTVHQGENNNQWLLRGTFTRKANKVYITELPLGYSLKGYLKVLDKLEDDKKIIQYDDSSESNFDFAVQFNRKILDAMTDEDIIKLLKLEKKVSENYTVMNHINQVKVFDNPSDIFWAYYDIKIKYLQKRKDYLLESISHDIRVMVSKYVFIKGIIEDTLVITKRPTEEILKDMDAMVRVIKKDDSYDYLMNMPVSSLTSERMAKLIQQIKDAKVRLDFTKSATLEEMWLADLEG